MGNILNGGGGEGEEVQAQLCCTSHFFSQLCVAIMPQTESN